MSDHTAVEALEALGASVLAARSPARARALVAYAHALLGAVECEIAGVAGSRDTYLAAADAAIERLRGESDLRSRIECPF